MTKKISFFVLFAIMMAWTMNVNATGCTGLTITVNPNFTNQTVYYVQSNVRTSSYILTNNTNDTIKCTGLSIPILLFSNSLPMNFITGIYVVFTGQNYATPITVPSTSNTFGVNITFLPGESKTVDVFTNINATSTGTIQTALSYTGIGLHSGITYPNCPPNTSQAGTMGQSILVSKPNPTVNFTVSSNTVCPQQALYITNTSTYDSTLIYEWNITSIGQLMDYNIQGGGISFYDAGTKNIDLVVIDQNSNILGQYSKVITVHSSPQITNGILPQNPILGCGNTPIILSANITGATIFHWKNGVDSIVGHDSIFTVHLPGIYSLEVLNSFGCKNYWQPNVSVQDHPLMNPQMSFFGNQSGNNQQQSDTVRVCNSNGLGYPFGYCSSFGVVTLLWDNNFQGQFSHTFYQGGKHYLKAYDGYGCMEMDSIYLIINPLPNAIITGDTMFCEGNNTVLSLNSGAGNTYFWNNGGMLTQSIQVNWSGMIYGTVTNSFGCSKEATPVYIQSIQKPDALIVSNDTNLAVAYQPTGNTYQWYYYNNIITGATNGYYAAKMTGWYKVDVTNSNGCSKTSIPLFIYYNNTTGIITVEGNDKSNKIYPNPFTDRINIEFTDDKDHLVILYDIVGKEIITKYGKNTIFINENLNSGIYFIKIDSRKELAKIIKN